jgi:hypothetical protein
MSGQDFKKFAAELISPSELFESHRERSRTVVQESIELLGSLANLTRSSLVTGVQTATTTSTPSALQELPASSPLAPSVQYRTSRSEYQQALNDQRIAQALAALQGHRQNPAKSRTIIRPGQEPFKPVPVPSVNASVKETRLTSSQRRPSECQPILRENDPNSY